MHASSIKKDILFLLLLNRLYIFKTYPFGDIAFKLVGLVGFENESLSSLAKSLSIVNREADLVSTSSGVSLIDFLLFLNFVNEKIGDGVDKERDGFLFCWKTSSSGLNPSGVKLSNFIDC